jgi:hypothetical protein
MIIHAKGFATSVGGSGRDDDPAYICCTDESGYCLSLARFPGDELVEVMVVDQRNHRTREVAVELTRNQLRIALAPAAAAKLDGITADIVPLTATDQDLLKLDAALSFLFEGGNRERYVRKL